MRDNWPNSHSFSAFPSCPEYQIIQEQSAPLNILSMLSWSSCDYESQAVTGRENLGIIIMAYSQCALKLRILHSPTHPTPYFPALTILLGVVAQHLPGASHPQFHLQVWPQFGFFCRLSPLFAPCLLCVPPPRSWKAAVGLGRAQERLRGAESKLWG